MAGYSRTDMGDAQVGGGHCAVDKLGTRVAGEAGDRYTKISNIF